MAAGLIAGVDLGGTKILTLVVGRDLKIAGSDLRATDAAEGPEAVLARIMASVRVASRGRALAAIGISTPGPCDPERGVVTSPPNLPGWSDVPLAQLVSQGMHLPAWIENDANAAAIAEQRLGAGRGSRHMVLVILGTGIGGGLILDGRLYRGASGAAGEIGHMQLEPNGPRCGCGRRGCLEALASGRALRDRAAEIVVREPSGILARIARDEGERPTAESLGRAAAAGDVSAQQAITTAGRYLGAGLTNLVDIFNPEIVVLGGSLRKLGPLYLDTAREIARVEAFPQSYRDARIVEAELGDEAGAFGAALIALERLDAADRRTAESP